MSSDEKWVSFDCYGTLIDWRAGMTAALEDIAPGRSDVLIDAYHRFEPGLEASVPFVDYKTVLTRGLGLAASCTGDPLTDDATAAFAQTLPTWPPFGETRDVLTELRARGWKVAILTNCDRSLIGPTVTNQLAVPIDDVITAEEVQSYKPGGEMFDELLRRHRPGTWVHAGMSVFHDLRSAQRRGARTVLVAREGTQDTGVPDRTLLDLHGLPDTLDELA